jgi:Cdc6-like AAA superfamily ATPase
MLNPWFAKGYEICAGHQIVALQFSDENWQIYKLSAGMNILIVLDDLATMWSDNNILDFAIWKSISVANVKYYYLLSPEKYMLAPLSYIYHKVNKMSSLSFASALRETRKILPEVSLDNSIFLEQYSRLLPISLLEKKNDDKLILGTWISGGVSVSTDSMRRLLSLTPEFATDDIREIVNTAGLEFDENNLILRKNICSNDRCLEKTEPFTLTGAEYLEKFFFENVIDIVLRPEKYESLGITFPSPMILYGKPGSGKTYAVEKLSEFLDWPIYSIDSSSIASKYIHETPKMIADIFNKAFETSPSIVIIDEMESYLSRRESSHDHKVEEVGEFLRLIPIASKNNVLVIGMTNLFENLDPAVLRTGRFDHKIEVHLPNANDVKAMLENGLQNLPLDENVDLDLIIHHLIDKPRSDTTFVIKEAARLTGFRGKPKITQEEFDTAIATKKMNSAEPSKNKIGF